LSSKKNSQQNYLPNTPKNPNLESNKNFMRIKIKRKILKKKVD